MYKDPGTCQEQSSPHRLLSQFCTQAPMDSGPGLSGTAEIATGDKHIALALECSATDPRSSVPLLPACPPLWPINFFLTLDVGWEIRPPQVSFDPCLFATSHELWSLFCCCCWLRRTQGTGTQAGGWVLFLRSHQPWIFVCLNIYLCGVCVVCVVCVVYVVCVCIHGI